MKHVYFVIIFFILCFKAKGNDISSNYRKGIYTLENETLDYGINSAPCNPNPCLNEGTCIADGTKFKCECKKPYLGEICDIKCDCQNGYCVKDKSGKINCICLPEYGLKKGTCTACDCGKAANCTFEPGVLWGFMKYCLCADGKKLKEKKCKDPCANTPCQFGGTCENLDGINFNCTCKTGSGKTCENQSCLIKSCQNGGTCENLKCVCRKGFAGDFCELKDVCLRKKYCENGGTCQTTAANKYKCFCEAAYAGPNCQYDNACLENPCLNGGSCTFSKGNFTCECKSPYYGTTCEKITDETTPESTPTNTEEITERTQTNTDETTESTQTNTDETNSESSPTNTDIGDFTAESTQLGCYCGHNSIDCHFSKNERKICYCKKGYAQKNEICIETCADSSECLNSGVCRIQEGRYGFCECQMKFGGDKCEINFLCAELEPTCKHIGAMCAYKNGIASCVCPPHKVYELDSGICKDICDEKSCLNGQCINSKSSSTCRCNMGYTGVKCDIKMSEHKYLLVIIFVLLAFILISFIIGFISFSWILWRLRSKSENQEERI